MKSNDNVRIHMGLLGLKARDKVTGFSGVITSVSFDLFGCVQVVIDSPTDDKGKKGESYWFDVSRLIITGKKPVMEVPNYDYGPIATGEKGPAGKPMMREVRRA